MALYIHGLVQNPGYKDVITFDPVDCNVYADNQGTIAVPQIWPRPAGFSMLAQSRKPRSD